jgi:hypothetical protein
MSSPAISVAMSVYNGERFLAPAIESILAQTFTDFEFLILNDGSKDNSAAIIDGYAAKDARIRPIHRENKGLVASLNQLIDEAKAPLIARMDGDDIAKPERFQRQIDFLNANPDHGVVGSWTEDIDEDGQPYILTGKDHPTSYAELLESIEDRSPLCHPSVMMRRDVVRAVGGYHAAYLHCEDYDLWLRLANETKMCSIAERLMRYRHSPEQISTKYLVTQQVGVAISKMAYRARQAGLADPTEHLSTLPDIDDLDAVFNRPGTTLEVRAIIAASMLYSPEAMRGDGFGIVLQHIRDGNHVPGLKRTILRLLRFGEPARAMTMASALLFG